MKKQLEDKQFTQNEMVGNILYVMLVILVNINGSNPAGKMKFSDQTSSIHGNKRLQNKINKCYPKKTTNVQMQNMGHFTRI